MRIKFSFYATNDRLGLIKYLRDVTGCGLKQGKDASDTLWNGRESVAGVIVADVDPVKVASFYISGPNYRPVFLASIDTLEVAQVWDLVPLKAVR